MSAPSIPVSPPAAKRPPRPPRPEASGIGGAILIWVIVLKSAMKALMANKLRSILAMLGIIIGVAAVIAMLAMGAGAQEQVTSRFQAMGSNLLFIRPGIRGSGGVFTGTQQNLKVEDGIAIAQLPGVVGVSPVVDNRVQAKYMSRNNTTSVRGVATPYFKMRNLEIGTGRSFTEAEAEGLSRVVVLGPNVVQTLFGAESPLGEMVKLNNINFRVIGVMKPKGDQWGGSPDDQGLIPYTTAMKILSRADYLREIDVSVNSGEEVAGVSGQPASTGGFGPPGGATGTLHTKPPPENSLTAVLRKRHRLTSLEKPDDFMVQNMSEALANVSASISTFRILLGTIASISLLVGGIGIMNIMLVTVTERTREIGVRKAIGAKNRAVLTQFVVEAVFLSGLGGLIGAGLGIGTSWLIAYLVTHTPGSSIPVPAVQPFFVVLSVAVSAAVGVIFGVYPAYRAAQLDPIEALRYE
jgi:ABC-type antimicrobial peptide transport system permease subunit